MIEFFTALGLAFVIEGIIYAAFPDFMKRMMVQILSLPTPSIRTTGLTLAITGVTIVWLAKTF